MPTPCAARRSLRLAPAALALASLLSPGAARAAEVCYVGGPLLAGFQLNGDALLDGKDLILTRSVGDQRSSVMYVSSFSAAKDFHVQLAVVITQISSGGADGIAFLMHRDPAGPGAIGEPGGGIGYQGISPSIAVEFDTYHNPWDPDANHIGLTRDGDVDHTSAANSLFPVPVNPPGVYLKSGKPISLWIDYTHATSHLAAYASADAKKPAVPVLSVTLDLQALLGATFTLGFTSSTGGSWSQHEVSQLIATDEHASTAEACCASDDDCAGSLAGPLCDPVKHLCGPCFAQDTSLCPAAAPACDLSAPAGACVPGCDGDLGASSPHACSSPYFPSCRPSGTCASCDGDLGSAALSPCPAGAPFCSPSGYCGRCSTNADCLSPGLLHTGSACNSTTGTCTAACQTDADCGPGNACAPQDHSCGLLDGAPCDAAASCRSALCSAGLCGPPQGTGGSGSSGSGTAGSGVGGGGVGGTGGGGVGGTGGGGVGNHGGEGGTAIGGHGGTGGTGGSGASGPGGHGGQGPAGGHGGSAGEGGGAAQAGRGQGGASGTGGTAGQAAAGAGQSGAGYGGYPSQGGSSASAGQQASGGSQASGSGGQQAGEAGSSGGQQAGGANEGGANAGGAGLGDAGKGTSASGGHGGPTGGRAGAGSSSSGQAGAAASSLDNGGAAPLSAYTLEGSGCALAAPRASGWLPSGLLAGLVGLLGRRVRRPRHRVR